MKRPGIVLAVLATLAPAAAAGTLDTVKSRGVLVCGVNGELPGFSVSDARGQWTGFDVDYGARHDERDEPRRLFRREGCEA